MTHEYEVTFADAVEEWFRQKYGRDAVETGVYQPEPYWFVDIVVDTGYATLFIEVENDAGSVRNGIAQALGYAAADPVKGVPMVVTPVGHVDSADVRRLRRETHVLVREFDMDSNDWW